MGLSAPAATAQLLSEAAEPVDQQPRAVCHQQGMDGLGASAYTLVPSLTPRMPRVPLPTPPPSSLSLFQPCPFAHHIARFQSISIHPVAESELRVIIPFHRRGDRGSQRFGALEGPHGRC